ncbi:MAG: MtrAB system histidine kinase MtrB [Arcanobacterium sp.]|nr:MtrAB system histidine kinase MtrB [Arcanobacterium sp.]
MTQTPVENSSETRGVFEAFSAVVDRLIDYWRGSLRVRVISIIAISGILITTILAFALSLQVKNSVFDQARLSYMEQFVGDAATAQENFSATATPTAGQIQQTANQLVSSMYDPNRGLLGAILLRTPTNDFSNSQILEPSTASATKIRSLLTTEMRSRTAGTSDITWQSVEVELSAGETAPGLIMGTSLQIPNAGSYELYAAYSLESQEKLLDSTVQVMLIAIVVFIVMIAALIYMILRMVFRPVQDASKKAQALADGEFETRMEIIGDDELAHLARSFNTMAASLEDQFARLNRMSAIQTEFVSAVSHELRSPVTTIRMAGQLIFDKREELPSTLKRSTELLQAQIINLDAMLSDLLEISRYDAGAMTLATDPTDLAAIALQVLEINQPLAVDNQVQTYFTTSGDTTAEVEPRRIERVIRNLVVNALEHAQESEVRVRVIGGEDAVSVLVEDHGIGISPDQAAHVFDRFWRADSSRVRKTGGTGLGLTIALEDALIHGGTLEATGELGVGASFLLTVPRIPGTKFVHPVELSVPEPDFTNSVLPAEDEDSPEFVAFAADSNQDSQLAVELDSAGLVQGGANQDDTALNVTLGLTGENEAEGQADA